ncbi:hypothetical protein JW805_01070 [Roseomonas aeriglobus]|nr:hypothetical protein [Roseomonas aeriglobus]
MLAPLILIASAAATPIPTTAKTFIARRLDLAQYRAALIDLNRDGQAEVLVYAETPATCGSGGCDLYVLTPSKRSYRVVTRLSVARTPISVLNSVSHGWRDLSVRVAGGGIARGYDTRLRFDGRSYPGNPTVPPATRLGKHGGRVILK